MKSVGNIFRKLHAKFHQDSLIKKRAKWSAYAYMTKKQLSP